METGCTLWFTGMSGAGKSTVSTLLAARLRETGAKVELLDGDVVVVQRLQRVDFHHLLHEAIARPDYKSAERNQRDAPHQIFHICASRRAFTLSSRDTILG